MKPHLSFHNNIENLQKVRTIAFTVFNTVNSKESFSKVELPQ